MKLPTDFPALDNLLKKLGVKYQPFVPPEIKEALVGPGVPIEADEIAVAANSTLEYQGQKVILYIRDAIGGLPKYHIVDCRTLKEMRNAGKYNRYVVTRRTDGEFLLNFADNLSTEDPETYRLDICKNCLWRELGLGGIYSVDAFPIADWFNAIDPNYKPPPTDGLYGPMTTPAEDPTSNYPPDWNLLSFQCRERVDWRCEECGINLKSDPKFLHAHHLRGTAHNNPEDLRALCIGCHAEQDGEGHRRLESHPDYQPFMNKYGEARNRGLP